jgi:hypothetical protein
MLMLAGAALVENMLRLLLLHFAPVQQMHIAAHRSISAG